MWVCMSVCVHTHPHIENNECFSINNFKWKYFSVSGQGNSGVCHKSLLRIAKSSDILQKYCSINFYVRNHVGILPMVGLYLLLPYELNPLLYLPRIYVKRFTFCGLSFPTCDIQCEVHCNTLSICMVLDTKGSRPTESSLVLDRFFTGVFP